MLSEDHPPSPQIVFAGSQNPPFDLRPRCINPSAPKYYFASSDYGECMAGRKLTVTIDCLHYEELPSISDADYPGLCPPRRSFIYGALVLVVARDYI